MNGDRTTKPWALTISLVLRGGATTPFQKQWVRMYSYSMFYISVTILTLMLNFSQLVNERNGHGATKQVCWYTKFGQLRLARFCLWQVGVYKTRLLYKHSSLFHSSLLAACLTSQQHASVSQGRICSDNFTCCHTEIEVAEPTFYLTQSQYTDTGPTSPSAGPMIPGTW